MPTQYEIYAEKGKIYAHVVYDNGKRTFEYYCRENDISILLAYIKKTSSNEKISISFKDKSGFKQEEQDLAKSVMEEHNKKIKNVGAKV